jgi:hypothetical protein
MFFNKYFIDNFINKHINSRNSICNNIQSSRFVVILLVFCLFVCKVITIKRVLSVCLTKVIMNLAICDHEKYIQ